MSHVLHTEWPVLFATNEKRQQNSDMPRPGPIPEAYIRGGGGMLLNELSAGAVKGRCAESKFGAMAKMAAFIA